MSAKSAVGKTRHWSHSVSHAEFLVGSRKHRFEGAHEMNSWSVASASFLCLLGVAASLTLAASVPEKAEVPQAHTAANPVMATPWSSCFCSGLACPHSPVNALSSATNRRFSRRVFIQITTPPSLVTLNATRLQVLEQYDPPRLAPPLLRASSTFPSNRQRAP